MSLPKQDHIPEAQLHAYLDSALDEGERIRIDAHISACQECHQELENIKALFAEIESMPEIQLEIDLAPIVTAAIKRPYQITTRWKLAISAQTIIALIVLGISWSMMNVEFLLPQIPTISFDLQATVAEINITINSFFNSLVKSITELFQNSGGLVEDSSPTISTIYLLPLAISATLLWLVGNRVLLNNTNHNGIRAPR